MGATVLSLWSFFMIPTCSFLYILFTLLSFKFPDGKTQVLYIRIFIKALSLEAQ